MQKIHKKTIIFISGYNGVGKTTIARTFLLMHPEFIIIQNTDIVREILRNEYAKTQSLKNDLELLNKSASELTYEELYNQSNLLTDALVSICKRLINKKLRAIIEGINICYECLVNNKEFLDLVRHHDKFLFINLYLNDIQEIYNRISNRNIDNSTKEKQLSNIKKIFINNNENYDRVCSINNSHMFNQEIINIDVKSENLSKEENLKRIISIIETNLF